MHVGIDFGTTNSSVAHFDGEALTPVQLDSHNENPFVLPSLIYVKRDHETLLGSQAAVAYLQHETGRRPIWERRHMGAIQMIVAGTGSSPIEYMHDIYDSVDIAAHGRLLQSVKTALRDPEYEGTTIFDRYYTIDELVARLLQAMKQRVEAQLEMSCDEVVLGRPVRFSDDPAISTRAEKILYRAARFAGFEEITFQLEPIAAAYLYHRNRAQREIAFVFDFGGGTLDLTVAEVGGDARPRVLATRGVLVGGDDLDRRIMESLLPYFGAGSKVGPDVDFPYDMLEMLKRWQTMPYLSRPQPLGKIRQYQESSDNPRAMHALETLVSQNLGFALFKIIEQTKKHLSSEMAARLDFVHDAIRIHELFWRDDFEALIAAEIQNVVQEIHAVLREAGVRPDQVDVVLRTGGSALVPAFVRLLSDLFGPDSLREMDPLTSVVGGMAVVAQEEAGRAPGDYVRHYVHPLAAVETSSGRRYTSWTLRTDRRCYTDRDYTLTRVPLMLSGLPALRTADLDYEATDPELLRLTLDRPARVFVAFQAQAQALPEWLRPFRLHENSYLEVETPGGRMPFLIYSRDVPAGPLTLGGARAAGQHGPTFMNYLVAFRSQ